MVLALTCTMLVSTQYCYFKCYFVLILINGPAGINASFIYLKITASQLTKILSSRHKILRNCSIHVYTVELQWLEHLRDYENTLETRVVRAHEC